MLLGVQSLIFFFFYNYYVLNPSKPVWMIATHNYNILRLSSELSHNQTRSSVLNLIPHSLSFSVFQFSVCSSMGGIHQILFIISSYNNDSTYVNENDLNTNLKIISNICLCLCSSQTSMHPVPCSYYSGSWQAPG